MKLYRKNKNEKENLVLIQDYPYRHALVNEFHTSFFSCKLLKIELTDMVGSFIAEENMQYILLHMEITNDFGEEIELYPDDFLLSVDQQEGYIQELPVISGQFAEIFSILPQQTITGFFFLLSLQKRKRFALCILNIMMRRFLKFINYVMN